MIKKFTHLGNAALAVGVAAFALSAYWGRGSTTGNIWGPGGAPQWLAWVAVAAVFMTFWAYARSKGRSGWLGLVLPLFNFLGLIILLRLEDRSDRAPDTACPQCTGKNEPTDASCRYCHAALPQPGA